MDKLTAEQLTDLAECFSSIAQTVSDYIDKNAGLLTPSEEDQMEQTSDGLLSISNELFTTSAILILDEASDSINELQMINSEMKKDFVRLKNVQKAINVAAAVLSVAAAIVKKDPGAAKDGLQNLITTWNK